MDLRETWTRVWPPLLAAATVGAVGVPAAVASYRHARTVVARSGDPVMAPWLPLSVDGMLLAALVVIWVRRHRGEPAGAFPWVAFGAGMVATVAANLAAAEHTAEGFVVALWPPVAFALTLELVALVAHRTAPPGPTVADLVGSRDAVAPAPADIPAPPLPTAPAHFPVIDPAPALTAPAPTDRDDRDQHDRDPTGIHTGNAGTPGDQRELAPGGDRDPVSWAQSRSPIPGWRLIQREFPHLSESQARTAARDAKTPTRLRRVQ